MDSTPSVSLPRDAPSGIPPWPAQAITMRGRRFEWGARTYLMGIVNVTPDSFSGDGLLSLDRDGREAARALGDRMLREGADLLDVGGESSRPGHVAITDDEERSRVLPILGDLRGAHPNAVLSIDTTKWRVAEAALDAGADLVNHVWGVAASEEMLRLVAERGVPLVVMHNRREARYHSVLSEVIADLQRAIDRALAVGVNWASLIVDPGIGFGKTMEHNLLLLRDLKLLQALGRPILLGASRKSTIGKVLDLPADQRLEGTLATTALGIASGADIVRVHDLQPNLRVARMADAIVRGVT